MQIEKTNETFQFSVCVIFRYKSTFYHCLVHKEFSWMWYMCYLHYIYREL